MYLRPSPTEPDIRFGRLPDRRVAARGSNFAPSTSRLHCLSPASAGLFLCAEHDRQLGGGSPLSSLMVAKD
jgi:hypothetical protein